MDMDDDDDTSAPTRTRTATHTMDRHQWIQMMEKENSNTAFQDESSITFLQTYGNNDSLPTPEPMKASEPRGAFARHAASFQSFLSERKTVVLPEDNDRRAVNRKGMVFRKAFTSADASH